MNRTMVRFTGAAVAAAAVLALSAPAFAEGGGHGRGGHFSTGGQNANGADRGGNRGGGNSGGNRGGGGDQSSGASGGRSNNDSARYSGGSRYHGTSNAERASSGSSPANSGAPRYGNGAVRPGNSGARNVEGPEAAASSRYRGRMPSGKVGNRSAPNPAVANGNPNSSTFRSNRNPTGVHGPRGGVITDPRSGGNANNFGNDRGDRGDRHYGTPRVPGVSSNGRYLDRGRPGYSHPSRVWYGNRPYWGWNGGYWRGGYWPRAYYRPGFIGFVTLLPSAYSTYWYGGTSYYYANDLYYTWNPDRYGYVVTNPPPVVEEASSYSTAPDADDQAEGAGPGDLYVYPRNGQSEEQTAQDRFECHQWAVNQTGFDPTVGEAQTSSSGSSEDYHRAIIACLDGRGYSAN
jgi:hypothetical protein